MAYYRANKYNAICTEYNGVKYDSKAEAARAEALDFLVLSGHVKWWIAQPKFYLGCPENVYRPDFLVVGKAGGDFGEGVHVEDVKGRETQAFRKNRRLWVAYGPCPLHIIKARQLPEILVPKSMQNEEEGTHK